MAGAFASISGSGRADAQLEVLDQHERERQHADEPEQRLNGHRRPPKPSRAARFASHLDAFANVVATAVLSARRPAVETMILEEEGDQTEGEDGRQKEEGLLEHVDRPHQQDPAQQAENRQERIGDEPLITLGRVERVRAGEDCWSARGRRGTVKVRVAHRRVACGRHVTHLNRRERAQPHHIQPLQHRRRAARQETRPSLLPTPHSPDKVSAGLGRTVPECRITVVPGCERRLPEVGNERRREFRIMRIQGGCVSAFVGHKVQWRMDVAGIAKARSVRRRLCQENSCSAFVDVTGRCTSGAA
jgi:hypothetical protein